LHSGALKLPSKEPSVGIQLPKRQSQSIGLSVCIVLSSPATLPVKEALLIEALPPSKLLIDLKCSTEPDLPALLLMKATSATERDSLS